MLHILLREKKVVLASGSPRRKDILQMMGLHFVCRPPNIAEDIKPAERTKPRLYASRIALEKCKMISKQVDFDSFVIAADTIVYCDKVIFSKPKNRVEAIEYLSKLSGRIHTVYTALAISYCGLISCDIAKTAVKFRSLSSEEIDYYFQTNEPMDKAGAYGIQGFGGQFIESINGCYFNVMGLPVNLLYEKTISLLEHRKKL